MKRYIPLCLWLLMIFAGCAAFQRGPGGSPSPVEQIAGSAAPLLPPPWGMILGVVAAGATGIATVGANKASNAGSTSPLVQVMTKHNWTMPALGGAIFAARAAGLIHMSDSELLTLFVTLGIPEIGETVLGKKPATPPTQ